MFYKGARLGFQIGAGLGILIIVAYFQRSDLHIIFFQLALGIAICTVAAGLLALQIMKDIVGLSQQSDHREN